MRLLTYILVGAGAAIAVIALAVVLLDNGEQQTIAPQTETGQSAIVTAESKPDDTPAAAESETVDASDASTGAGASQQPSSETVTAGESATAVEIDLAQVRPDGNAVFAGTAPPNAVVTVFEGEVVLGSTTADASGEWVIVPEKALGAGEHLISVGAETVDGATDIANVTLAIKVGEASDEQPLVALLPQSETEIPELLQSPDDIPDTAQQVVPAEASGTTVRETAADPAMPTAGPAIAPRSLSWQDGGELTVSGVARGGVSVSVTSGGAAFGSGDVDEAGDWQVAGKVDLAAVRRVMRFALADKDGEIVATYELPVATRDLSQGLDGSRMVIVQQGDALWRIAYRSYGEGIKYVDIVRRNAAAIDDPDLIFPNQIFALPK